MIAGEGQLTNAMHAVEATQVQVSMPRTIIAAGKRPDLLRRFTPMRYRKDLSIMAKTVRLETNRLSVIESASEFFARYQGAVPGDPEFLWRIVSQEGLQTEPTGPAMSAFSDQGIRFANIGQRSFLAVDLEAREGIGFVAESLVEGEPMLNCRSVFDTLFCMSAGSLGMVALAGACVGLGGKGFLIFGPPNSGKTTASYLATKLGLEFHADQAVFLEIEAGELRVWGDLLPAIFREESLQHLPELRSSIRRFTYPELTVCYLPKRRFQAPKAHSVAPVGCVFLERGSSRDPILSPLSRADLSQRVAETVLFQEDDRFVGQSALAFRALEQLPAYHLAYGEDPAMVAPLIRELLVNTRCERESETAAR
jgi:hypothetical protein